ncbi:hypothetical protein Y032_0001g299 [Ancylostoma ceylanicum]|uniref:Uncharacterized protein n=1 Tax=Ancylostoma ceylanicum TaxID=53326 RepID=A0A016W4H3_9BILA|nr:hypothetical protein Y032_0001g299 [Ancylostoma ceylanicum]
MQQHNSLSVETWNKPLKIVNLNWQGDRRLTGNEQSVRTKFYSRKCDITTRRRLQCRQFDGEHGQTGRKRRPPTPTQIRRVEPV